MNIATVSYTDFVGAFPALSDQERFPMSVFDFWLSEAPNNLNAPRLGKNLRLATMLFVAHNMVLEAQNGAQSAEPGGIPGTPTSPIQSQTVGAISVTYDTAGTELEGAGAWNATSYGQRLYTLMKAAYGGPIYRVPPRRRAPW